MRVYLHPQPLEEERRGSGVDLVVAKMYEHLPRTGEVEFVDRREDADLYATHISPPHDEPVDVLHCHGLYPTAARAFPNWAYEANGRIVRVARTAYAVTVPSEGVAQIFRRDMGFDPHVVPHGLDLAEWPERLRDHGHGVVLWNKNRDVDVCDPVPLNALATLCPDFQFVSTFGETAPNVRVTGTMPHPQMRKLLYTVGIYYSPTPETFGIGILEAMAAGLPVLAWDWGNAPYLVAHNVNGYLVPPGDTAAARSGLLHIMEHYPRLARAARETAARYTWEAAAERYVEVYREALERREHERRGKISVVIPCYNYAHYVGGAIASVKAQAGPEGAPLDLECIVIDDGSSDGSAEAITLAIGDDDRFQLIEQENRGVAETRNLGAWTASGAYLMFLDADDYLLPGALHTLRDAMRRDRGLGMAYGRLRICDAEGQVSPKVSDWPGDFSAVAQLRRSNQAPSCNLMRREAFLRTGGFRQHTAPCEDAELWARLPLCGYDSRRVTDQPVYVYRMHEASASAPARRGSEPDWTYWLPAANKAHTPFAAVLPPAKIAHPVYPYDQPWVSFVIPVGPKHTKLLGGALESVAAQRDVRWECIVVDDSREDASAVGMLPYRTAYPWVRWMANPRPGNVSAARNAGAQAAQGRYLCFLDADDYLLPDFLPATMHVLANCKSDGALVYTDWISSPEMKPHVAENWHLPRLLEYALFAVTFLHPRSAFHTVGGFDEDLPLWEDWDYTIRLGLEGYKGIRVPKPLFVYRYDTGERRERSLEQQDSLMAQIKQKYVAHIPKPRRG